MERSCIIKSLMICLNCSLWFWAKDDYIFTVGGLSRHSLRLNFLSNLTELLVYNGNPPGSLFDKAGRTQWGSFRWSGFLSKQPFSAARQVLKYSSQACPIRFASLFVMGLWLGVDWLKEGKLVQIGATEHPHSAVPSTSQTSRKAQCGTMLARLVEIQQGAPPPMRSSIEQPRDHVMVLEVV